MINIIKSEERHTADFGWLQTRWHFSFGDYHDPTNVNWSQLRVFNDDVVQGGGGFELHPHRDMEIVTYVLDGQLEHQDSAGNEGVVRPGEVQVMTAGKGIFHAEHNASADRAGAAAPDSGSSRAHRGNAPRWAQRQFTKDERAGRLLPVVSGGDVDGTLTIDQDATIYVSSLEAGESVTHAVQERPPPRVPVRHAGRRDRERPGAGGGRPGAHRGRSDPRHRRHQRRRADFARFAVIAHRKSDEA